MPWHLPNSQKRPGKPTLNCRLTTCIIAIFLIVSATVAIQSAQASDQISLSLSSQDLHPAGVPLLEPGMLPMSGIPCGVSSDIELNCNDGSAPIGISPNDKSSADDGGTAAQYIAADRHVAHGSGGVSTPNEVARMAVVNRSPGDPYIVDNGVQMYEVSHGEAGGWRTRAASDDTYGNGELIVVAVKFNERMVLSDSPTFRIRIGSGNRDLPQISTRNDGKTILFGTLIRPQDRDSDGIWIGDNDATLAHNPAGSFQSVADSEGVQRDADLAHDSVGTLSDHKVNGRATRPLLRSASISSAPQHGDFYVRGESVRLSARFDRPVVVTGRTQATLKVEVLGANSDRLANYVEGSGGSTLVYEHFVSLLENDSSGIVIPRNTLAENGNLASGVNGGGSIVGQQGGLIADLSSRPRGPLSAHKVDARFTAVPEIMAGIQWGWEQNTPHSDSLTMDFNINEDPGHFSETSVLVLALNWGHIRDVRFAVGLRTDVDKPGTDGSQGKGVIFNRWGTSDTETYARPADGGWVENGDFGGPFISVRKTFDWGEGDYSLRIAQDGADDSDGRWYGFWIKDESTNAETHMGSLKFPLSEGDAPQIRARSLGLGALIAILGDAPVKPHEIPVFEAALALPDADGGALPNSAAVDYSQLNGVMTNSNVSYDSDTGKITLRVGGATNRRTSIGTTLTGLTTPQLTAVVQDVPESHDGSSSFTFRLAFSEELDPDFSYRTLRDSAFTVAGGDVTKARRLAHPSNIRWEITVAPDSNDDITIVLHVPEYCGATGAICTGDGRKLSESVTLTVSGPTS